MMNQQQIRDLIGRNMEKGDRALTEAEAKQVFQVFGIPVVREILVREDPDIPDACEKTGWPVVLKAVGGKIMHKSESGLVRVGLAGPDQVQDAAAAMRKTAGDALEGFLIQPVVQGKREFVAGMFRDDQFGPVIVFGLGGVLTEALSDVVFRVAPLDDADIREMLEEVRSAKLLGEFRGERQIDFSQLASVLKGLSDMALAFPEIREVDINPLIAGPDGNLVAVDGLVVPGQPPEKKETHLPVDFGRLGRCFYPGSIAFVGASGTPGKWGHILLTNTLSRDFKGDVYLVNPKGGEIAGRKVYKSIVDIGPDVDLAVVSVPAHRVLPLIPELKKKNVLGMLLVTSGFREVGEKGAQLESELVQKAGEAGILVLGPNTMGICNPHEDFYCTASHVHPVPGSTVLVCQSGNMGTQLLAFAEQQDIGIRSFSGSGNEAMVTIEDYMEAFEIDELTRTVVLYIESVKNGERFFKSARRLSMKKPVVVLKGGRTRAGEKAASSHTGAMASDIKVFDAACRQAGIIQVNAPMELLDLSAVFSSLPMPKGNRVAIMTLGGGWGVVATDLCAENGLEVPPLSEAIIERLNGLLPSFWSHENPVDIVGEQNPEIPKTCLEELLKWDGCDAVIHLGIHGERILAGMMTRSMVKSDPNFTQTVADDFEAMLRQAEDEYIEYTARMVEKYQKPVIGVSLLTDEKTRTLYRVDGCAHKGVFFPTPERAVKALWGMCRYSRWRENRSD